MLWGVRPAASRGYGKPTCVRTLVADGQEVTMSSTDTIDEDTTGTRTSEWYAAGYAARERGKTAGEAAAEEGANMNRVAGAAKV